MMLTVGDKAPLFVAPGTDGDIDLAALLERGPVVLYFFPRAMTGGCTIEAVEFTGALADFAALGFAVVGVSVDSAARLQTFRGKYDLKLQFASDSDRGIGIAYGTLKGDAAATHERDTVVIAKDGVIRLAYQRARARGHAAGVLADVKGLRDQGAL
jgi:peroxiredoxin Q/BCP